MNAPDPLAVPIEGGAPPGYRLGNFELQGAVVSNANGVVYRAWDHNLGIPVAVREYLPLQLARRKPDGDVEALDADTIDAFERGRHAFVDEARLLARCDHASLVRVRQLLQAHGTAYRVMPWYAGRPLLDVRREMQHPPDEPALRALLADLLSALAAYHRVGGVHGSVNPAQILLLEDDRALLLGPGAVRRATAIDAVDPLMQKLGPGFAAPEQLAPSQRAAVGPWTDLYALACVVRFCISGMLLPPPDGRAPEPLKATVDRLYFDAPGVRFSEQFLATLDAAASPHIENRPQTAAEFGDWLTQGPRRPALSPAAPAGPAPDADGQVLQPAAPAASGQTTAPVTTSPAAAAAAPAIPTAPATTATPRHEEGVDADTVALIRRVIDSIPERTEPPLRATSIELAWQAGREPELPEPPRPRRRPERVVGWLLLVMALLAAIGYAAWELQGSAGRVATAAAASNTPPPQPQAQAQPPVDPLTTPATPLPAAASAAQAAPGDSPAQVSGPAATVAEPAAEPSASTSGLALPTPTPQPAASPAVRSSAQSPRQVCGDRTEFSLYRCMQQQCAATVWARHPQCLRLKETDRVD